jgi:hypothetical protein
MKKIMLIITVICFTFIGCSEKTIDDKVADRQEEKQKDMDNQVGDPDVSNYTEKKNLKYIYELKDRTDLICYLYTRNEYTGKYIYEGECMGYGVPYSTQYSNPERYVYKSSSDSIVLPQAEPNGLFIPTSSSATWIIRLPKEKGGDPVVEYYEQLIFVSPVKKDKKLCEKWSIPDNY